MAPQGKLVELGREGFDIYWRSTWVRRKSLRLNPTDQWWWLNQRRTSTDR